MLIAVIRTMLIGLLLLEPAQQLPMPSPPVQATSKLFPETDTVSGGRGQVIDGIPCGPAEMTEFHVHAHLTLVDHGRIVAVPIGIGIVHHGSDESCVYWIHTHDDSGLIHIEAPKNGHYRLGSLFHIWGVALSRTQIWQSRGYVTAFVDGKRWNNDPNDIALTRHARIVLETGQPILKIAPFTFPDGS